MRHSAVNPRARLACPTSARAPERALGHLPTALAILVALLVGCTSLGDDVRRAEQAFSEARYEDVEEWLDDLEPSVGKMSTPLRARYYYLAGMSAYRIGQRAEARHALALCREELAMSDENFPAAWKHNLETALDELSPAAAQ
ncbi:MAG: hypothetical protein RLZZ450_2066 [Pseudomonadota bacterium]|jgi:hypothetical protein